MQDSGVDFELAETLLMFITDNAKSNVSRMKENYSKLCKTDQKIFRDKIKVSGIY